MKRILTAVGAALVLVAGGCTAPQQAADAIGVDQTVRGKLPASVRDRGTIRFMTDASYAPMEYFAADGRTIAGFDADLADALGSTLGIRIEMVQGTFETVLDDLAAAKYDGVLTSMTDTPARQKKADFVDYFAAGTSIIVQRGNPARIGTLADLCGHVAATERGTIQADMLERVRGTCPAARPLTVHSYPTNADALLELRTGRAAAVLNDFPPAAHLATDPRTNGYFALASAEQFERGLFGIAVAKDDTELRDALHAALDRLISNGTYAELLRRWGLEDGAVTAAQINGAH
jgi:polar amino acid transport system substrate-binding protein